MKKIAVVSSLAVVSALLFGCASEAVEENAPASDLSSVDTLDDGYSYNGWDLGVYAGTYGGYDWWGTSFTRYSGDTTRGGGVCLVAMPPSHPTCATSSASGDAYCTGLAQASYGSGAYGYCSRGYCFYKAPSATDEWCLKSPSNAAGANLSGNPAKVAQLRSYFGSGWAIAALGCMTKTAGPNTACGGTNNDLFMRDTKGVDVLTWSY